MSKFMHLLVQDYAFQRELRAEAFEWSNARGGCGADHSVNRNRVAGAHHLGLRRWRAALSRCTRGKYPDRNYPHVRHKGGAYLRHDGFI
jgi:hypothetical protein